ncbi:hypothetical protein HNR39_002925 [Glaciimonas immobilis]|uniref:Uncharacterized protein n=1 Tax=Glaciimonas immobilis TaxID=728004 RepID=A0A840RW26_9BURK|nr:hypothetical protein [Glaciimonas immobilis]
MKFFCIMVLWLFQLLRNHHFSNQQLLRDWHILFSLHAPFQIQKETFYDSVIPVICATTHTADNAVLNQQSLILSTGIVDATI